MAPKIVDKETKAREIARAAIPVFRRMGYHATRMLDIAEQAGVGKGTLYEYFRDKEAILRFELDRYFADFQQGATEAVSRASGAIPRLMALVEFSIAHVGQWEDHCGAFFEAVGTARLEARGREWFAPMFEESHQLIRGILAAGRREKTVRRDVDLDAMAELVVSLYEGFTLLGLLGVRGCRVERFRDAVVKVLEKGVAAG